MNCRNCKTDNTDDAKFCRCCGIYLLDNQLKACTNRRCKDYMKFILPSDALFCSRCGHTIKNDSQVGLKLGSILGSLVQNKKKEKYVSYRMGKYQFVDLGLTHKWANCNLEAVSLSPMDRGKYYAWGETEAKTEFSRGDHIHIRKKRFFRSDIYKDLGDSISGTRYDPVTVFFQCEKCHLPTEKDWMELVEKCEWIKSGMNLKVIGPNGNYIILPYWDTIEGFKTGKSYNDYLCGDFPKEKSHFEDFVQVMRLTDEGCNFVKCGGRYLGRMVRPVCDM